MTRLARSIDIAASPTAVWAVLVDIEHWPIWASQFERLERLDGAPLALRSRVRVEPGGMRAAVWVVTEYEDERSFTWEASLAPGLRVTGGHVLSPTDDGVNAEFWLEAGGLLSMVLAPLLRRRFAHNTQSAAEGLKRFMEAPR
jgi:hypothetical protein